MSVSIQSVTYLGLHLVPVPSQARRWGSGRTSNCAAKVSASTPHCSVPRSQDEEAGCSIVTYETTSERQWMNGCYMGLRMRSNALFNSEASHALHQHFHQEDETSSHIDTAEQNASSIYHQIVSRHSSFQPSQVESYGVSGLVVFDECMFGQLGESSFTQQYGHLVNRLTSARSCINELLQHVTWNQASKTS